MLVAADTALPGTALPGVKGEGRGGEDSYPTRVTGGGALPHGAEVLCAVLGTAAVLTASIIPPPPIGQVDLGRLTERGRMLPGGVFNEEAATSSTPTELKASLIASSPVTEIISFTAEQLALVTGGRTIKRTSAVVAPGTLRR